MRHPFWPLYDLSIRTPRLEIHLPDEDELVALARLAAAGIHDPMDMPFAIPWTDVPSPSLERNSLQWWWRQRAEWSVEKWSFTGGVFVGGEPVGVQDLAADDFPALKRVGTGSWLGRAHQGQGLGKEMRSAILHLAFAGLGAREAHSGAWADNPRSHAVSAAMGYVANGERLDLRRGVPVRHLHLRLDRETWETHRRDDISIEGLDSCLEMFVGAEL